MKNCYLCLKIKEKFAITRKGKLFFLPKTPKEKYYFANLSGGSNETELWHKRKGHLSYRDLKNSLPMDLMLHEEKFETCCLAKTTKNPVPKQNKNKASKAGERVFTDFVGPITPPSVDGFRYFVTFIDDCSSHACFKFMRHKHQALKLQKVHCWKWHSSHTTVWQWHGVYEWKFQTVLHQQQNQARIHCSWNCVTEWCRRAIQPNSCWNCSKSSDRVRTA